MTLYLSETDKAYFAGFLDGDGSINAQIVRRNDYLLKFQIRVTITFFQKTKFHWHLEKLQKEIKYGVVRKRNDGMSEYSITGPNPVKNLLQELEPFVQIKKPQLKLVLEIIKDLPTAKDPLSFLILCEKVDRIIEFNFSKKRTITSETVRSELSN